MWSNSLHFQWLLLLSLTKFRCSFSSWKVVGSWTNRLGCMCVCGRKDTSFHTKQPFWCDSLLTIYYSYQEDGPPHLILLSVCLVTRMLISTLHSFKLLVAITENFTSVWEPLMCLMARNVVKSLKWKMHLHPTKNFTNGSFLSAHCGYRVIVT